MLLFSFASLFLINFYLITVHIEDNINTVSAKVKLKNKHNVPLYMLEMYNNGINSSNFDVVRGVFPKFLGSSKKTVFFRNHERKNFLYIIPKRNSQEKLVKAEIRLTKNEKKQNKLYFQLYIKKDKWEFLDEKIMSNYQHDWISFEITSKIKNLNLKSLTFLFLTFNGEFLFENYVNPILLLSYLTENPIKRRKRSLNEENYEEITNQIWEEDEIYKNSIKKHKNICRKKPLYISFSDIDYDSWIVAPTGYEAFQCVGKCTFPVGEHLSPTKHAILQTLLHNISPSKAQRACCVPTKLDPISILYIDGNGVLTYKFRYNDMVVAECGCR